MRILRKTLGYLFILSTAAGFLGFPSDLPTWYRCARRLKPCPDSLANLSMIDATMIWHVGTLALGLLLLVPPSWLQAKKRLAEPPLPQFYRDLRGWLLSLRHEGLL